MRHSRLLRQWSRSMCSVSLPLGFTRRTIESTRRQDQPTQHSWLVVGFRLGGKYGSRNREPTPCGSGDPRQELEWLPLFRGPPASAYGSPGLNGGSLPGGTPSSAIASNMATVTYVPVTAVRSTTCCSPRMRLARSNVSSET